MEHFETLFEAPSAPSYELGGAPRPSPLRARCTSAHATAATVSILHRVESPHASQRMRRRVGLDSGPFPLSGKWPYGDAPKADNPL